MLMFRPSVHRCGFATRVRANSRRRSLLRCWLLVFVERYPPCDVLQELRRNFFSSKNARCDGKPDCRFETIRCVVLPNLSRSALMVSVDQLVEVGGGDFAALPAIKVVPEFEQGGGEFAVVRDTCPLSYEPLDTFRCLLHRKVLSERGS